MPTYIFEIEPYAYIDSQKGTEFASHQFDIDWAGADPLDHEIDQIKAFLRVSLNPNPTGGQIFCEMPANKKHAKFKTFRTEQALDLILKPDQGLEGRTHFLKAEVTKMTDKQKGARVEYLDTNSTPPRWTSKKFEEDLPNAPQHIRIVFGMEGETPPFNYDIYIRDIHGAVEGLPCDPQASNDPPQH